MQRTVLQLIVLPYLSRSGPGRYFTTTVGCYKTVADVDNTGGGGVTTLYPPWSASRTTTTVTAFKSNDPRVREGDQKVFAESSIRAQKRERLLMGVPDPPKGESGGRSITRRRTTSHDHLSSSPPSRRRSQAAHPPHNTVNPPRRTSESPPSEPATKLPPREQTALEAMQRVIAIHTNTTTASASSSPSSSLLSSAAKEAELLDSSRSLPEAAQTDLRLSTTTTLTTAPSLPLPLPLPPSLHMLISRRQYRLAVFHLLQSPSFSDNTPLINRVADILDSKGAGNLGYRLRASLETPRKPHPDFPSGKLRLPSVPKDPDNPRTHDFWKIPNIPPSLDLPQYPGGTTKDRLTIHYNAHLSYLLHKSSFSPYGPLDTHFQPEGGLWPAPNPRLFQLSRLLRSIDHLEKSHGFVPDRVTANIIMSCWLHCGLGQQHRHSRSEGFMPYTNRRNGEEVIIRKELSPFVLDGRQVMLMFKIVSLVMDRSLKSMEAQLKLNSNKLDQAGKVPVGRLSAESMELRSAEDDLTDELEWSAHVLPFANMIKQALRKIGGEKANVKTVLEWEKGMKVRLADWRSKRSLRRKNGNPVGEDR